MKTLRNSIALIALVAFSAFAQQYIGPQWPVAAPLTAQTTLTSALAQSQGGGTFTPNAGNTTTVCLASATGVVVPSLASGQVGSFLFVDREMMQITQQTATLCFRVKRGQNSTPAQMHAVNAAVWVGQSNTLTNDPSRPGYSGLFPVEDASPVPLYGTPPLVGTVASVAAPVAGSIYWSEISVEHSRPVTGICVLNGATVGTDNHIFALYDYAGNLLGQTASTLAANASLYQCLPLVTPVEISGFRVYFIAVQSNGTTALIAKYVTGQVGLTFQAGSQTGAFGTIPAVLPVPYTFTTATGPIGALY